MTHQELKIIIDNLGLPARGRVKMIADKTGYSTGMVSKLLSGHATIADRFITVLNSTFQKPEAMTIEWLRTHLDELGIPEGSRIKTIAEKTGYSVGTVGNILSGSSAITERFIALLDNSFSKSVEQSEAVFTLRDKFAMSALAGIIAEGSGSYEADAKSAYRYADEMLKARTLQPESI